jgi:hypothetical protein
MRQFSIINASYKSTGVQRFDGNPFIEALPPLEKTKLQFLTGLSHYPATPSSSTRKSGEIVRIMELSTLNDVVFPFPEYQRAAISLATMMRDTYVSRNPLTLEDKQRRYALAVQNSETLPFPKDWKSSAKGHFMMAVSGMGKTTFVQAFLLRYPQVITHEAYRGNVLKCKQIVYVVLRVPHDATLKSLCIQFFEEIDYLLGTNYVRDARAVRQIAPMVLLMNQVATAVSLGFLVIDEVQNLKSARGGNASFVLNLFSEIIERLGISLFALATPAVQSVIEGSVRNARRMASYGETIIKPMRKPDPQWKDFCGTYWDYTYVKNKGPLDDKVIAAWWNASAGNTAFAALAFMLAQRNEIGGREIIDVSAFSRVSAMDMAFLQPAVTALKSRDPEQLRKFDDLLFSEKYKALRKMLGADESISKHAVESEFEDIENSNDLESKETNKKQKSPPQKPNPVEFDPPMESPLKK